MAIAISPLFEIAGGSVSGHAHVRAGRNNQDALGWANSEHGLVAVVCDGCGSGARSEVGAHLGARLIVQAAATLLGADLDIATLLETVRQEVLAQLGGLATAMSESSDRSPGGPASLARTVSDYFLFTVVGVISSAGKVATFSLGDGLVVVNGERHQLGPYPNNEPPYLGYALLPGAAGRGSESFQIHRSMLVEEVRSLLLGTDGVVDLEAMAERTVAGCDQRIGALSQFWTDDRYFRNPDLIRRRLTVINRGASGGLLPDDTTLVVMRRTEVA